MKNQFTETETISYGNNVKNAFGNIIFGIILFIASFILLWWNEGNSVRLTQKENFINKNAVAVSSNNVNRANDRKLIAANGKVYTDETLSDSLVNVKKALRLNRKVEMYQWVEHKEVKEHKNADGSVTKTTTYSYEQKWDDSEHNSNNFKHSGYKNPAFPIKSVAISATNGKMGEFIIKENQISRISDFKNITSLAPLSGYKIFDNYYYKGNSISNPQIGDIRISYRYVPSGTAVSIIGQQNFNNTISEMTTKSGAIYLQYNGILTLDEMLNKYKQLNMLLTFMLRLAGFIIMFFGMKLLISPIITIAGIIPYLSETAEFISSFILFFVALILSLLTIAIAWFAYRPLLSICLIASAGIIIYFIKQNLQGKKTQKAMRTQRRIYN